jgi:hypothetical protein
MIDGSQISLGPAHPNSGLLKSRSGNEFDVRKPQFLHRVPGLSSPFRSDIFGSVRKQSHSRDNIRIFCWLFQQGKLAGQHQARGKQKGSHRSTQQNPYNLDFKEVSDLPRQIGGSEDNFDYNSNFDSEEDFTDLYDGVSYGSED